MPFQRGYSIGAPPHTCSAGTNPGLALCFGLIGFAIAPALGLGCEQIESVRHIEEAGAIAGILHPLGKRKAFGGIAAVVFGAPHSFPWHSLTTRGQPAWRTRVPKILGLHNKFRPERG